MRALLAVLLLLFGTSVTMGANCPDDIVQSTDAFMGSFENYQFSSEVGIAKNSLAGTLVGFCFGAGIIVAIAFPFFRQFALYVVFVSLFHFLEFVWSAYSHPQKLSFDSWCLVHSDAFQMAMFACVTEYWLEYILFDGVVGLDFKGSTWGRSVHLVGVVLMVLGQLLRTTAMFQASSNFTHLVAYEKAEGHHLVTHGVYTHLRHPSYCGWFWWSVGCQLMLFNPVCAVGWAFAAWRFFSERIGFEEGYLLQFFGEEYRAFHARTYVGIPFLSTTLPMKAE